MDGQPVSSDRLIAVNEAALQFFVDHVSDNWVPAYMRKRGFRGVDGVGYAPGERSWKSLVTHLERLGFSRLEILGSGLALKSRQDDGLIDRFHDRVVLSIKRIDGATIAFVGRLPDRLLVGKNSDRKYINSQKSSIYDKTECLLGEPNLSCYQKIALVEGPFDYLAVSQAGFPVVGVCGSGFTSAHAQKIARAGITTVMLATDSDDAGRSAAAKAHGWLLRYGVATNRVRLSAKDPAEVLATGGEDQLGRQMRESHCYAIIDVLDDKLRSVDPENGLKHVSLMQSLAPMLHAEYCLRPESGVAAVTHLSNNTHLAYSQIIDALEAYGAMHRKGSLPLYVPPGFDVADSLALGV